MSNNVYQIITDRIIAKLEAGTVPWRKPWASADSWPLNLKSGKPYRGVNVFMLACAGMEHGYTSQYWLTYKQAKERGGNVRKGEKSELIVFWTKLKKTEKQSDGSDKDKIFQCLRYYRVFNVEQCDGIEYPKPTPNDHTFNPIAAADGVWSGYDGRPTLDHGGGSAHYRPTDDHIQMPESSAFRSDEAYYSTLFHEAIHSTGHKSRLDRLHKTKFAAFGSSEYSREELIAEMGAAMLCGRVGIFDPVEDNSVAYIAGWLKALRGDSKLVVTAAAQAQRAADWIIGERWERDDA